MKPVRIRPKADQDIGAFGDRIAQDDLIAALRFLDATQTTFGLISENPSVGSLRFSHLPSFDVLRVISVNGFENHLVFYIERQTYLDILRILHSSRDIPAALRES
jgi:toxin ParE1/3/4